MFNLKGFKAIVSLFFMGLFASTSLAQFVTVTVDWDQIPWTPTNLTGSYIVDEVPVEINIEDVSNALVNATPVIYSFYQGDQPQPVNALLFATSLPRLGTSNRVRISINLGDMGIGYDDVNFKLFDVDGEINNFERREQVTVSGFINDVEIMPTLITGNVDVHDIQGNVIYGNLPVDPIGGNSSLGVVEVSFTELIDTLTIDFAIEEGALINPTSMPGFGLYDLSFVKPTGGVPRFGDLEVSINNCEKGVSPTGALVYTVTAANIGFQDITGATLTSSFPAYANNISWECVSGICNGQQGNGELNEVISLSVDETVTYFMSTELMNAPLFETFQPSVEITASPGTTEESNTNNSATDTDIIYPFIFKNSFECYAAGD
ncbi:hypothetical protein [Marinicella sp. W31]|uniref:hypothetical protein n=1 Tax=Marinicella sp. W31 TaxID=3023713 RepID=UPI0037566FA6